ncbi:MAG: hypothetical protein K9K37_06000 [Desulfocapsa sp.]|nr:hypothetical protein [Desulfocapsa sp.]
MNPKRAVPYYYLKLSRLKGYPQSITPTIPFHTMSVLLITLLTRTSTITGLPAGWGSCSGTPLYHSRLFSFIAAFYECS